MATREEKVPLTNKRFDEKLAVLEKKITKMTEESDGRFNQRMDHPLSYIGDVKRYLENEISAHSKLLEIGLETSITGMERRLREQNEQLRAQNKSLTMQTDAAVAGAEERLHQHFDKVLTKIDPLIGEIRTAEAERAAMTMRLTDHEDRLEKLESVAAVDKGPTTSAK